jgi:acetyltransferase-like isoleucine patch superfamily enzyme
MKLNKFSGCGAIISPMTKLGKNVRIGDRTIIYDNVEIGDNTIICNDCVIGEPLNSYYNEMDSYNNPKTILGANSLIRSHTIIYAGNIIGDHFQTGHRGTIRENSLFGSCCSLGTLDDIQGYSLFGDYCRLHSNVHIGMHSKLGNFVFVYPYVVFTNDPTPPSDICIGPTVGDFSQIATGSILLPGVIIGKHCLIGAGSSVTKNVDDFQLVMGCPAKVIKDVREIKDRETGEAHYPWPYRFDRNMPWHGIGFEQWDLLNNKQ